MLTEGRNESVAGQCLGFVICLCPFKAVAKRIWVKLKMLCYVMEKPYVRLQCLCVPADNWLVGYFCCFWQLIACTGTKRVCAAFNSVFCSEVPVLFMMLKEGGHRRMAAKVPCRAHGEEKNSMKGFEPFSGRDFPPNWTPRIPPYEAIWFISLSVAASMATDVIGEDAGFGGADKRGVRRVCMNCLLG